MKIGDIGILQNMEIDGVAFLNGVTAEIIGYTDHAYIHGVFENRISIDGYHIKAAIDINETIRKNRVCRKTQIRPISDPDKEEQLIKCTKIKEPEKMYE